MPLLHRFMFFVLSPTHRPKDLYEIQHFIIGFLSFCMVPFLNEQWAWFILDCVFLQPDPRPQGIIFYFFGLNFLALVLCMNFLSFKNVIYDQYLRNMHITRGVLIGRSIKQLIQGIIQYAKPKRKLYSGGSSIRIDKHF